MSKNLLAAVAVAASCLYGADVDRARQLYEKTEYRASLEVLNHSKEAKSAAYHEIAGKSWYMVGDFKKAIESFDKAIEVSPNSSQLHNWLGRALGRRAETSNPIMAPGYASKARQAFEKAVSLDPKNTEAVNDLFQYYLEAPGFLGGGMDKAATLANSLRANDQAEYHFALAQIAERRKQYDLAEGQLRRAAELAPKQIGRVIDLAKFLARHGKYNDADQVFQTAARVAPQSPQLLYARAETYVESKRNLDTARALLEQYLKASLTPDDPSREDARRLLKQISE